MTDDSLAYARKLAREAWTAHTATRADSFTRFDALTAGALAYGAACGVHAALPREDYREIAAARALRSALWRMFLKMARGAP